MAGHGTTGVVDVSSAAHAAATPSVRDLPAPTRPTRLAPKAARLPAHAALRVRARRRPPSAVLRRVPPMLGHPSTPSTLGRFHRRAVSLRQLELLASGT
jgi:hypothetical protein